METFDELLDRALKVKTNIDDLILMGDSLCLCTLCGRVSDTMTCQICDYEMNQRYDEENGK